MDNDADPTLPISIQAPFPTVSSYTPLSTHQESTPTTFFGGRPVLYASLGTCEVSISQLVSDLGPWTSFLNLSTSDRARTQAQEESSLITRIAHGYVASDKVVLLPGPDPDSSEQTNGGSTDEVSDDKAKGVAIPYPSIILHATKHASASSSSEQQENAGEEGHIEEQPEDISVSEAVDENTNTTKWNSNEPALYLQVITSAVWTGYDDEDNIAEAEIFITPLIPPQSQSQPQEPNTTTQRSEKVQEIFAALSKCADLHPDPMDEQADSDNEGSGGAGAGAGGGLAGLLAAMSGGGGSGSGWITSENAHEYEGMFGGDGAGELEDEEGYDEEGDSHVNGNGNGGGSGGMLGPGAGTRRERTDTDMSDAHADGVNGNGNGETKWQRTD